MGKPNIKVKTRIVPGKMKVQAKTKRREQRQQVRMLDREEVI